MDTETKTGVCESCRKLKPVAWTDTLERDYCPECVEMFQQAMQPRSSWMMTYLMATIPFQVGDRVRCYTAGALYDGIGTIDEISFEPEKYGTPVYPSFHVVIEEKAYPEAPDALYYTETCLHKAEES